MNDIVNSVRAELISAGDEKLSFSARRFFKESIQAYGVRNAVIHKLAKDYFKRLDSPSKQKVFDDCDAFWKSGFIEEAFIACDWSYFVRKQYVPDDFQVFSHWIHNYVTNWATCDTLCNHTVGEIIMKYPHLIENLKEFTRSDNRWVKRAAAVSLIIPAKKGLFLRDILEIAGRLLTDKDDMVQKGYGWLLKETSVPNQHIIFEYVMDNQAIMPRTSLRYAIEKMPAEMRKEAMGVTTPIGIND